MRKDRIESEAYNRAVQLYSERGMQTVGFTHPSTDYFTGTSLEPDNISTLKPSYGEYESLGKRHRELTRRIKSLNHSMVKSRQNGAFQVLQNQMKEIKDLVKEREDIDAKMSVLDLARKKTDDQRLAASQEVSYSERINTLSSRISELELSILSYMED